jgi:phosphoribosylpyrophosphate synthetase
LLASGAVVISSDADGPLTVRAVLGELRADLRHLGKETEVNVNVTALAGYVRLTVPLHSDVIVHTPGTILTRVTVQEPGQVEIPLRTRDYTVHVLGVCGAVSIVRA